jgi:phosphate:Na+ symporter
MGKIANFHTLFNIISTIILFPFIGLIEKLTMITIRDNQRTSEEDEANYLSVLNMLDERVSKIPNLAITNSTSVIESMGVLSEENFRKSMLLLKDFQTKKLEKIQQREDAIDKLDEEVVEFLVKLGSLDVSKQESVTITALMKIETEFEKIGDYAYKFSKKVEDMHEKNIKFSEIAYNDFERIYNVTEDAISTTIKVFKRKNINDVIEIEALKEFAEMQIENNRNSHIQRLKDGKCNVESGIAFLELLTICEKVIDHCLNISIATTNYMTNENFVTKQEFRKKVYKTKTEILKNKLNQCNHKYAK